MTPHKKWQISPRTADELLAHLLLDRGYESPETQEFFLNPPAPQKILDDVHLTGLAQESFHEAATLIQKFISEQRPIVIHGDYDVDGICATAILWKTIYQELGYKNCQPFIPNRFDHGYGLSKESINSISNLSDLGDLSHLKPLLITVDCGITAFEAVEYAKEKGFEVLVVDHHVKPEKLPQCAIFWSEKMCAAGLAWAISQVLLQGHPLPSARGGLVELAALATIADLQPLTGFNRSLVKFGLEELNRTKNVGLKTLIRVGGIEGRKITTFEVGWVLAPRLNASGRLESALESLRLICTNDEKQALEIATNLNRINSERQDLTRSMVELAREQLLPARAGAVDDSQLTKINVVVHGQFHEGIIGLVAGKLVQEYGLPSVVISRGVEFSKASARSVSGFNVVEFLRSLGDLFQDIGGHAGAAGFTIRTEKIENFLLAVKGQMSKVTLPERNLNIDAEVKFEELDLNLLEEIKRLEPFGLGNPEPVFLARAVQVGEIRTVGFQNQHLKLKVVSGQRSTVNGSLDCIGFDLGQRIKEFNVGEKVDLVFYLNEDTFNGNHKLSLKLKDLRRTAPM